MIATLLLGGNMGNRIAYFQFAKFFIRRDIGKIILESSIYETEAWGQVAQKDFLNQVIEVDTSLNPSDLLNALLLIEKKAGRTRKVKWGNRSLDLDILLLEDHIISNPNLQIPHPEIQNRRFVLEALYEIKANFTHPLLQKKIAYLYDICGDKLEVKIYKETRV